MGKYVLRRIIISIPVLIGITIFNFMFIRLAPGDPITMMMPLDIQNMTSAGTEMSPELRARIAERLGLDKPLPVQYFLWLGEVAQGNLGRSMITNQAVTPEVINRLWPTLKLTTTALFISIVVGITVGIFSALNQYTFWDYIATVMSFIAVSVPGFFLALVFIYIFALKLHLLPTSGEVTLGAPPSLWDHLSHLIMPASVLGLEAAASLVRYTRSSMLEVLRQEYITTARAKGLKAQTVIVRHALRNSLIPLITIISLRLPGLFGGAVIIEQVFFWGGMGSFGIKSVLSRDYPILMALNLISAVLVLTANLVADISYAFADPRIRYE
ncbi:MAG: ABC transporter permease [Chloroflexi bacterium]|nr:ABC transporter permease [Chloroflexota bacterium]